MENNLIKITRQSVNFLKIIIPINAYIFEPISKGNDEIADNVFNKHFLVPYVEEKKVISIPYSSI